MILRLIRGIFVLLVMLTASASPAITPPIPTTQPSTQPTPRLITYATGKPGSGLVVYLPGISAYRENLDAYMLAGLKAGGMTTTIKAYDWPAYNPGLGALLAYDRNRHEAAKVARLITEERRTSPSEPIYLIAHSGGCGIGTWALEMLPADAKVDQFIMLSSALSKTYDLTRALQHITGHLYVISSNRDEVVGSGTKWLGTIDRVQTESGGFEGFEMPPAADPAAYQKLVPMPYRTAWRALDHFGDHIGTLEKRFARGVITPLLAPAAKE